MKKKEVNLSKEHVDLFKNDDKSHTGRLAYTTAGWATVTHDGTILEVIDAFQGAKTEILDAFKSRNEIAAVQELDETQAINPEEIGLEKLDPRNDVTDLKGEITSAPVIACTDPVPMDSITVSPEQGFYFETEMNIVSVPYDSDDIIISFTDFNDATDNGCAWLFLRIRSLDDIANTKRIGQEISNSTDADVEVYLYTAENVITGPFADMQFPYHKLVTSNTPTIAPADTAFTPLDYVQGGGHPNKLMPAGEEIVALRFTSVGTRGTVILKIGEAGG